MVQVTECGLFGLASIISDSEKRTSTIPMLGDAIVWSELHIHLEQSSHVECVVLMSRVEGK